MKKTFTKFLGGALLALLLVPSNAKAVELASWTFETGYNNSDLVYTPNTDSWAQIGSKYTAGANGQLTHSKAQFGTASTQRKMCG